MQGAEGLGALYSCIGGNAQTVKFFINEQPGTGKVRSVKFLWNDFTKDIGYGVHADAAMAADWAEHLAAMYAPTEKAKVQDVFRGNKDAVIETTAYVLRYTYHKGPAADERMFVVTQK